MVSDVGDTVSSQSRSCTPVKPARFILNRRRFVFKGPFFSIHLVPVLCGTKTWFYTPVKFTRQAVCSKGPAKWTTTCFLIAACYYGIDACDRPTSVTWPP